MLTLTNTGRTFVHDICNKTFKLVLHTIDLQESVSFKCQLCMRAFIENTIWKRSLVKFVLVDSYNNLFGIIINLIIINAF